MQENWKTKALSTLWRGWRAAQHEVNIDGKTVVISDLRLSDAEIKLRESGIIWLDHVMPGVENSNVGEWLKKEFPVILVQNSDYPEEQTVEFYVPSLMDYAAILAYTILKREGEKSLDDLSEKLLLEGGINSKFLSDAIDNYPDSIIKTDNKCKAELTRPPLIEMPGGVFAAIISWLKQDIPKEPSRYINDSFLYYRQFPFLRHYTIRSDFAGWFSKCFSTWFDCLSRTVDGKPRTFIILKGDREARLPRPDPQMVLPEDWRVIAFTALWEETHQTRQSARANGQAIGNPVLLLSNVHRLLLGKGINFEKCRDAQTMNIADWLKSNFPVLIQPVRTGTSFRDNVVVFYYDTQEDYAAVSAYDVLKKQGNMPFEQLAAQLRRDRGIRSEWTAKGFEKYPKSLKRSEMECQALMTNVTVPMPDNIVSHVAAVLSSKIDAEYDKMLLLSGIPSAMPFITRYYTSLSTWLRDTFPQFAITKKNGAQALQDVSAAFKSMRTLVMETLEKNPGVLYSEEELERIASEAGIAIEVFTKNKTTAQVLKELCDGNPMQIGPDGGSIYLPLKAGEYPEIPLMPLREVMEEMQQAMSLCYMDAAVHSRLKTLTEYTGTQRESWMRFISHELAMAFSNASDNLLVYSPQDHPSIAVYLHLSTPDKQPVYAILEQNPTPNQQPYKMNGIAFPGQEDEKGYGRLLCERFGLSANAEVEQNLSLLKKTVDEMRQLRERLIAALPDVESSIRAGSFEGISDFAGDIHTWTENWGVLDRTVTNLGWRYDLPSFTLPDILERIDTLSADNQMLTDIISKFDQMFEPIEQFVGTLYQFDTEALLQTLLDDRRFVAQCRYNREDCQEFLDILTNYYKVLRDISFAPNYSQEIVNLCGTLTQHFHVPIHILALFCGSRLEDLNAVDMIELQLNTLIARIDQSVNADEDGALEQGREADTGEMLAWYISHRERSEAVFFQDVRPADDIEKALVTADFEAVRKWEEAACGDECPGDGTRFPKTDAAKRIGNALSFTAIAARLLAVVGNAHRTAEKYLINACVQCRRSHQEPLEMLLHLYRDNEDRDRDFITVANIVGDLKQIEDQRNYVRCMIRTEPEKAQQYVLDHYYLLYDFPCVRTLRGADPSVWSGEFGELLSIVHEPNPEQILPDPVIQCIIDDRREELAEHLERAQNYTDEEILRIKNTLMETEAWMKGSSDYVVSKRLFASVGNKSGIAEYYLWRILQKGNEDYYSVAVSQIVCIMTHEKRCRECCRLYHAFQDAVTLSAEGSMAVIESALHAEPALAMQMSSDSLQYIMQLCVNNPADFDEVRSLSACPDKQTADYFARVEEICGYLQNEVYRGIILSGAYFREIAAKPEVIRELGFSAEDENRINLLRRTNEYPKDMDHVSIAERVHRFVGVKDGLAERFIRMALPDLNAYEFLLSLLKEKGDRTGCLRTMEECESLRIAHWSEYCRLMFDDGQYEKLFECIGLYPSESPEVSLIKEILYIRKNGAVSEEFGENTKAFYEADHSLIVKMISGLAEIRDSGHMLEMIEPNFIYMLDHWDPAEISEVITGGGTADEAMLLSLQQAEIPTESKDLLNIFLWTHLNVGDMADYAEKRYHQLVEQTEEYSTQSRIQALKRIQTLYPYQSSRLAVQWLLVNADQNGKPTSEKEAAQSICEHLQEMKLDTEQFTELLRSLKPGILLQDCFAQQTEAFCAGKDDTDEIMTIYHNAIALAPQTVVIPSLSNLMTGLYLNAFRRGTFPPGFYEKAEENAIRYLKAYHKENAMLCLVYIENALARPTYSDFALLSAAKSRLDNGEEVSPEISELLTARWNREIPTRLSLFQKMLKETPTAKEEDYCRFCGLFMTKQEETKPGSILRTEDGIITNDACDMLLSNLYAHPELLTCWLACYNRLPLQGEAKAKLLLICCIKGDINDSTRFHERDKSPWWECAEMCNSINNSDLLLETLLTWSEIGQKKYSGGFKGSEMLNLCRDYIEETLKEDPDFLKQWMPKQTDVLREIVERFFALIGRGDNEQIKRDLIVMSTIVAAVDDPKLLDDFVEHNLSRFHDANNDFYSLGFALFVRLMLSGRCAEARNLLLNSLTDMIPLSRYRSLFEDLTKLSAEELTDWIGEYASYSLFRLMLPDCEKMPPIEPLNEWTAQCIHDSMQQEGLKMIRTLCSIFPENRFLYRIILILLKSMDASAHLVEIEKAICDILSIPVTRSDNYDRKPLEYGFFLAGIHEVILDINDSAMLEASSIKTSAADFYLTKAQIANITDLQEEARNVAHAESVFHEKLQNRSEEERSRIRRLILSWITGRWEDILSDSWLDRVSWGDAWDMQLPTEAHGLAASFVRFLYTRPLDQMSDIVSWGMTLGAEDSFQIKAIGICWDVLQKIQDQASVAARIADITAYPLEESSMSAQVLRLVLQPDLLADTSRAKIYALVTLALMANKLSMYSAHVMAYSMFNDHEDRKSSVVYYALAQCTIRFNVFACSDIATPVEVRNNFQRYRRYRQLIALLTDDPQLFSRDLYTDIKNNYFNLVMQLLSSKRANEALLLRQRLPRERRGIVDALLYLTNENSDSRKFKYAMECSDSYIQTGLWFLMSRRHPEQGGLFINDLRIAQECNKRYQEAKERANKTEFIFVSGLKINREKAKTQIQPTADDEDIHEPDTSEETQDNAALDETETAVSQQVIKETLSEVNNLMGFAPLTEEEEGHSAAELKADYIRQREDALTPESRALQAEIAEKLYRMSLTDTAGLNQVDQLIQYVVDHFMGSVTHDHQQCMLVLLSARIANNASDPIRSSFRTMVNQSALQAVLQFEGGSLREVLNDFNQYRENYNLLMDMVTNEAAAKTINIMYRALDTLYNTYKNASLSEVEPLKQALNETLTVLSRQPYLRGWENITNALSNLLHAEFNDLASKPQLLIRVLNEGDCQARGKLFGEVENIGREEAYDIVLRSTFGNKSVSRPFYLNYLSGGGKALFDIGYEAEWDEETLVYSLSVEYCSQSNIKYQAPPIEGELRITADPPPYFNRDKLSEQTITNFVPTEDGLDVYSPDFIGRESEKKKLRGLYAGKSFNSCRNAVLYGIRRSGKTSLLNYLEAYLNVTRDDLAAVVVSGQAGLNVYTTMVESVIDKLHTKNYLDEEAYDALCVRWKRQTEQETFDLFKLPVFYSDVRRAMNGRGLVLIIDEFDRLLQKLDEAQDLESRFYPVLSSMLCDADMANTVHFLFCGNKELITEKNKDQQVTQFFQRMGSSDIIIGAMPKAEIDEMVTKPYADVPEVKFTPSALEWLWSMTGGLVWFSKIIAKGALKNAEEDDRCVVYPTDIFHAACMISVNGGYCRQCFEGCRDDERLVLEAMSRLAVRPDQYVAFGQMTEQVREHMSQERMESALRNLIQLELIESGRQNTKVYHFRTEIYRRYFRKQQEYPRILPQPEDIQDVEFYIVVS